MLLQPSFEILRAKVRGINCGLLLSLADRPQLPHYVEPTTGPIG